MLLNVNFIHSINYNQQFQLKVYSVNEGLSQFTTGKVVQDHYGFIWVNTYDGLNRFNGADFVKYRHDPYNKSSISGNRVIELGVDKEKNLWIVTENGSVDRYDYRTDQFQHYKFELLKSAVVTEFLADSKGYYWFGTTNGIFKVTIRGNEFVVLAVYFNSTTPDYSNFVISIQETSKGDILVGTIKGCWFLWHQQGSLYTPGQLIRDLNINSLFRKSKNEIWIGTNNGVFILNDSAIKRNGLIDPASLTRLKDYNGLAITGITRIDSSKILISTANSLFVTDELINTSIQLNLSDNSFFVNNVINSIIVDRTQTIWVGSQQKGIASLDLHQLPDQIQRLEQTKGMFVKMLFRDSQGRIWIGANFNGLYCYNLQTNQLINIPIPGILPTYMVFSPSVVEDSNGNIWLCVNERLFKINTGTSKIEPFDSQGIKLLSPFALTTDSYNSLWIGCTNGLVRYFPVTGHSEFVSIGKLSDMVSSEQVSRLINDKKHNALWACTKDNGVVVLFFDKKGKVNKKVSLTHKSTLNSLNSNHAWSVVLGTDGSVYIGTDSGLNKCIVKGTTIHVAPLKDLKLVGANKIMMIVEDKSQNLWLGTSQALFSYNITTQKEKKYTVNNGLFSNATLEAGFESNGSVFVGTINGVNIINTKPQPHNPFKADAFITDVFIFDKSIKNDSNFIGKLTKPIFETDEINLKYNENNISISFIATHYNDFAENIFEYKLEGYDKDYHSTDSRNLTVSYNKLPAGKYTFWVKASNNENVWGGKESRLTIVVKPAPWLSAWAFILYFILSVVILYFVITYINKEAKHRQQLQIKDIERQHEEELNAMRLRFHTNIAHDIRTPITLIAAPLEDIKNDKALLKNPFLIEKIRIIDKNVERLLYLVNQFLDFRRMYNSALKVELANTDMLKLFSQIKESFEGIAITKKINFEYIVDLNHNYLLIDEDKVSKVIINLLSNAFKYTSESGDVFVFIEENNQCLRVKIQDSGCGIDKNEINHIFERFYQAKDASSVSGTGIGLALVKQLVELLNGSINVESEKGVGTIFTVSIPYNIVEETYEEETVKKETDFNEETEPKHKHTLLIVEDDNDLRNYLLGCFSADYKTIEALNGQEGFDKALRYVPDLIITDIMMPNVDGVQLIKLVRNDYRISHIPILALTAKTGEANELLVLEAGAEDFIPKPFSTKALRLKVNNYLRDFSTKTTKITNETPKKIAGIEEKFLHKMNDLVLQNLENPTFSIDFICDKMAISRMQLHRKINTLLGKSTSEYIREIKMDVAKKLFEAGETDIETVMLKIGVSSSFHFNKNFKQRYGLTAQQFIKSINT